MARGKKKKRDAITLSPPWNQGYPSQSVSEIVIQKDPSLGKDFIKERTKIHETYIKEQEKTKRISLILSAILFITALVLIIFAPEGREILSYWVGAVLLIFAAGTAGYKRIWGKTKFFSFGADQKK